MPQIKFVPKECQGPDAKFSGHIMLRVPNFDEKYGLLEEIGLDFDEAGGVKIEGQRQMSFIRKAVRAAKPYFDEVAIKGQGAEYKSYDDLSADPAAHQILMNTSLAAITGMHLGNG